MTEIIDLLPQEVDLKLYAGDGVQFRLVVTDSDDNPVNLTGAIAAQIRLKRETTDPLATFSVDLSDAATGIVILSLSGEQTQLVEPPPSTKKFKGVWDVEWTPAEQEPKTLVQGKVECYNDVTR